MKQMIEKLIKHKEISIIVIVLLSVFFIGRCSVPSVKQPKTDNQVPTHAHEKKAQWYTCSMHPQVRSNDPKGKCPICGMDLIPVAGGPHEHEEEEKVQLKLSARAAALLDVSTFPAERQSVSHEIRFYGQLEHDERNLATVAAWVEGRVDEIITDFTGVRIEKGQPIARIYSPSLIAAQQELIAAKSAANILPAARRKLNLLGLSREQIKAIEERGRAEDHIIVHAPLSGTIIARHIYTGEYVKTGDPLFSVSDLSKLWLNAHFFESDLAWIKPGQEAEFSLQAFPDEVFKGRVDFIQPVVDSRTRSVLVRIDVSNEQGLLKPGMFVRGKLRGVIEEFGKEAPLVVPASAALLTGERAVVYVKKSDSGQHIFEPREVTLGPRAADYYIIKDGLKEGELVVTHGNFRIDSELQIRGNPSMMQPEGGSPPVHKHNGDE